MKDLQQKIKNFKDNDGLTIKNFLPVCYKSGWQVATEGIQTTDIKKAIKAIKKYKGFCGIWYSNGIYYVDKSLRVDTKRQAIVIGKLCDQISVYNWKLNRLAYC